MMTIKIERSNAWVKDEHTMSLDLTEEQEDVVYRAVKETLSGMFAPTEADPLSPTIAPVNQEGTITVL